MQTIYLFVLLVLTAILHSFLLDIFVYTEDTYYYAFSDSLSGDRIDELVKGMKNMEWIGYLLIPFLYAIKIFLVCACIYTGIFFANIKASFGSLFRTVVKCEFLFLIPSALRLFWFTLVKTNYTLEDIDNFPPFSILVFCESSISETWLKYALSFVNVIQLSYILLISRGISNNLDLSFTGTVGLIVKSYGLGLLLWILFVVFLIVSLT